MFGVLLSGGSRFRATGSDVDVDSFVPDAAPPRHGSQGATPRSCCAGKPKPSAYFMKEFKRAPLGRPMSPSGVRARRGGRAGGSATTVCWAAGGGFVAGHRPNLPPVSL